MLSLYKKGEIQIDYYAFMNRVSMMNGVDRVNINPTTLEIINVIAGAKSDFENVKINISNQSAADVYRVGNNILIQFSEMSLQSKIIFTCEQILDITKKWREMVNNEKNEENINPYKKKFDLRRVNALKKRQPTIKQGFDECGIIPMSEISNEKRKKNSAPSM